MNLSYATCSLCSLYSQIRTRRYFLFTRSLRITTITHIFEENCNGSYLYSESAVTEMTSLIS